ncbi:MAG: DUF4870 domain-containing protein [Clostridia bacterium]|nr:DUF4870 domain-containing protein [Clostridia bacterium]
MDQKVRGLLSYLFGWLGGLIVLVAFKDNTKETNKNACQAIVLSVTLIVVNIVISIISFILGLISGVAGNDVISIIVGIFSFLLGLVNFAAYVTYMIFAIMGMVKAYQEKDHNIPVITGLTQKIFKSKLA